MISPNYKDMEAGRPLDALIAEKVMGCKWECGFLAAPCSYRVLANRMGERVYFDEQLPCYSTGISAAWEVAETFIEAGCAAWLEGDGHTGYEAGCTTQYGCFKARADTAPLAICRAALIAASASRAATEGEGEV